jgi:hypothetical protein
MNAAVIIELCFRSRQQRPPNMRQGTGDADDDDHHAERRRWIVGWDIQLPTTKIAVQLTVHVTQWRHKLGGRETSSPAEPAAAAAASDAACESEQTIAMKSESTVGLQRQLDNVASVFSRRDFTIVAVRLMSKIATQLWMG